MGMSYIRCTICKKKKNDSVGGWNMNANGSIICFFCDQKLDGISPDKIIHKTKKIDRKKLFTNSLKDATFTMEALRKIWPTIENYEYISRRKEIVNHLKHNPSFTRILSEDQIIANEIMEVL